MFIVESYTAPFIADAAISAGATNWSYGIELAVDVDVADEAAEADADRQQVEERLEEPADEDQPRAAVHHHAALEQPLRVAGVERARPAPMHG